MFTYTSLCSGNVLITYIVWNHSEPVSTRCTPSPSSALFFLFLLLSQLTFLLLPSPSTPLDLILTLTKSLRIWSPFLHIISKQLIEPVIFKKWAGSEGWFRSWEPAGQGLNHSNCSTLSLPMSAFLITELATTKKIGVSQTLVSLPNSHLCHQGSDEVQTSVMCSTLSLPIFVYFLNTINRWKRDKFIPYLWAFRTTIPVTRWMGSFFVSISTTRILEVTKRTPPAR